MITTISKSFPGIDTGEEKQQVQSENKRPELKSTTVSKSDSFVSSSSEKADPSSDGKFSITEAIKNFGKGLLKPITTLFSSKRNFLLGGVMIAGGAILTVLTGGAILPLFIAVGVTFGLIEAANGAHKICTAKNGDDIEKAFLDLGSATSSIGLSFLGARGAIKPQLGSTVNISRTQAFIQCFKDIPKSVTESISGCYKSICSIPSKIKSCFQVVGKLKKQLSEIRSILRENEIQTKQIKPMTDKIYDKEIKLLAEGLGAREDRLRQIMLKRPNYAIARLYEYLLNSIKEFCGEISLGGFNFHLDRPRTFINPRTVTSNSHGVFKATTPRYRAIEVVSHEVNHGGQSLFPISQLTYREYLKAAEQAISKVYAGDPKSIKNCTKFHRILTFFHYRSTAGRRIQSLGIPKTKEAKLKAIRYIQDNIELGKANGLIAKGISGPYKEAFQEVDSRMISVFRKLQELVDDVLHKRSPQSSAQEFIAIENELQGEVPSFTNSTREHLPTLLQSINSLFSKARKNLLAQGIDLSHKPPQVSSPSIDISQQINKLI